MSSAMGIGLTQYRMLHSAKGDIPASLLVICVTLGLTFHFWSSVSPSVKGAAALTEEELGKWERCISATEG